MKKALVATVALGIVLVFASLGGCKSPDTTTTPLGTTTASPATTSPVIAPPTSVPVTTTVLTTTTQTHTATPTVTQLPPVTTPVATPVPTTPPPPTTSENPYSQKYHGYLLKGYPEDLWPLYGSLAIDTCALDIQFPAYNNGREGYQNSYHIVYVTDKTREEIQTCYRKLLHVVEESSFFDAIGTINGYKVDARWDDWDSDVIVYLSVLLPQSSGITENPLHVDFPEWLGELYEPHQIWDESYSCTSNPPKGTIISSKIFSHSGTVVGAAEYYRAMLEGSGDYKEAVEGESSGNSTILSGTIDEYFVKVIIGVWGKGDLIQVACIKNS